jgi:segregation and condensation protein B
VNEDEQSGSLADQAAAWVPPWQRATQPIPGPTDVGTDEPDDDDDDSDWQQPETDSLEPAGDDGAEDDDESDTQQPETDIAGPQPQVGLAEAGSGQDDRGTDGDTSDDDEDDWQQPETDVHAVAQELADDRTTGEAGEAAVSDRPANLSAALEAILLVVDEPVSTEVLAEVLDVPLDETMVALEELAAQYTAAERGFDLRRAAGGWRLYTRGAYATYVERFVLDGQSVRLTQAALETLAVIAYQQPVTRSRMSAIRGVNCDGVVRTLSNRGLIEECGTQPDSGAFLYRTTPLFLEKLGLDSLDELPPLAPFLPDDVNGFVDA